MAALRVNVSRIGGALVFAPFLFAGPSGAATVTVCPSGCDSVTIQGAATAADPGDTIQVLSLSPHTEGEIFLTKDLTIDGFGVSTTVIQADATAGVATVPVFVVTDGASVTMLDLTVRHGVGVDGGGITILDGHVALEDVRVEDNVATYRGGGIFVAASGSLETIDTIIDDNSGSRFGGGVYADGAVEMLHTDVTNNLVSNQYDDIGGGGIWSAHSLTLRSCRLLSNSLDGGGTDRDGFGGGLYFQGPSLLIEDSSISNNSSEADDSYGGGVFFLEMVLPLCGALRSCRTRPATARACTRPSRPSQSRIARPPTTPRQATVVGWSCKFRRLVSFAFSTARLWAMKRRMVAASLWKGAGGW